MTTQNSINNPNPAGQSGTQNYALDTGAANAYVVTLSPVPPSIVTGMRIWVKAANANTTASTLAVNGGSALAIKKLHDQDLVSGDIEAGQIFEVVYDGSLYQMLSQTAVSPGAGTVTSVAGAGLATGTVTTTGNITVTAAVQADMEAATSTTTAVTPAVVKNHPGIVKAWGLSNATLSALTIGYNVASVTDGGTGVITFNFTVAMSGNDFAATLATYSNDGQAWGIQIGALNTAGVLMYMRNSVTSALADPGTGLIFMACGDQ